MSSWSSTYLICGISIKVISCVGDAVPYLPRAMREFAAPELTSPDIALTLRDDETAQADPLKLLFPPQFFLRRMEDGADLCFAGSGSGDRCLGSISSTGRKAEIGLPHLATTWRVPEEEEAVRETLQAFVRACLQYRLLQSGGTFMHAAAISRGGGGYVFAGHTRSGKTTLSREFPAAEVLGDDLVAVRDAQEGFALFGTPWPGREGGTVAYGGVPLRAVFNLHPASETDVRRQPPAEALAELVSNAPRLGYPGEESKLLEIFSSLAATVPIFSMSLKLGDDVMPYLEGIASEEGGEDTTIKP